MDEKVKDYIDKQEEPKQMLLKELRKLLVDTIKDCQEEFSWGVPVYDGGKFYIAAMKERVHIGFAITGLSEEEVSNFEGGGKTMRHLKIYDIDDKLEKRIVKLIKLVHEKAEVPPDYNPKS
ncbi:MAG: DUF5655 domain-containing protein [Candidatus Saccharimonadales bacterium]|nr:DUF5655 domain-containing protein [Candidatus Saccharimonadales bacterium]